MQRLFDCVTAFPNMCRGSVLVVHSDRKAQRTLQRILGATGCSVHVTAGAPGGLAMLGPGARRYDLLVIEDVVAATVAGHALIDEARATGARGCLTLMSPNGRAVLPGLLATGALTNLLANPMPLLAEELITTALKVLRDDIFGLEKYLAWGVEATEIQLSTTGARHDAVRAVTAAVDALALGRRVSSFAMLVTDELLSNALFNAAVDAAGAHPYAATARDADRTLSDRETVSLRYACDARYLAIEVTDRFGSLDRDTIMRHLAKGTARRLAKVREDGGGAGMGMAMTYNCCNQLVFNLAPGQRTQIISLIDLRFKPSELGSMFASFNIFEYREPVRA